MKTTKNHSQNNKSLLQIFGSIFGVGLFALLFTFNHTNAYDIENYDVVPSYKYQQSDLTNLLLKDPRFKLFTGLAINTPIWTELQQRNAQYTLFIPTNKAFMNLEAQARMKLVSNPYLLQEVLSRHVLPGRKYTGHFYDANTVKNLNDESLVIERTYGMTDFYINNQMIVDADISTGDGVVHLIDGIITIEPKKNNIKIINTTVQPKEVATTQMLDTIRSNEMATLSRLSNDTFVVNGTLADFIKSYSLFSNFEMLSEAADYLEKFADKADYYTVFIPTNAAFDTLSRETVVSRLENDLAMDMFNNHVLVGKYDLDTLTANESFRTTIGGNTLAMSQINSPLVENSRVIVTDVELENGIVHVVDAVIME